MCLTSSPTVLDGEFPPGSTQAFLASQGKLSPSGTANSPLASPFIPVTAAPGPSVPHSAHRLHR